VKAAAQQAQTLLNDGDNDAAILLLRRTINQAPLNGRLRLLLARAYLAANRSTDAIAEATRAMTLTPPDSRADRVALTRLLADAMRKNSDTVAARAAYEQIIAAQPQHADWARLALAGLLESQGQIDEAEVQYRAVLQADRTNQEATVGLIRVYTARGDFSAALEQAPTDRDSRHSAAIQIFDHASAEIASRMKENREAWEAKKITREAFYKATTTQSQRAAALVTLLRSAPPPENSPDTMKKGQARRVLAASLLSQASTALLNFLETGNADSGSQADLWLSEFQKELTDVQSMDPSSGTVEAAK
jgi:tetratricopeptide (TPR) repeat protein